MAIGSLRDLYFDELGDVYDAELQMIRFLPRLVEAAHAPELREALLKHCDESRLHLERLQLIFTHWGERAAPRPCAGLAGIVQEADDRLNQPATADARDAAIIGMAQRIEHYEIAAYGCARTYARRLNRPDEARLLQETLDEEGRADRRLTDIAEAHVNDDARTEADVHAPRRNGRLCYVGVRQLDFSRLSKERLVVRNHADEDLGTLDGLIVDSASSRPSFIVVDARRALIGRRYLLPIREVRFDERNRVLRVGLAKEVAQRYPAFDREEFDAMDDEAWGRYETQLLALFPREGPQHEGYPLTEGEQPVWWMTGVWVTMPPERAERLTEETRSFANEFVPARDASHGERSKGR